MDISANRGKFTWVEIGAKAGANRRQNTEMVGCTGPAWAAARIAAKVDDLPGGIFKETIRDVLTNRRRNVLVVGAKRDRLPSAESRGKHATSRQQKATPGWLYFQSTTVWWAAWWAIQKNSSK